MSKFSERLSNLGQATPARMGFGRSTTRDKNPVMLIIGAGGDASKHSESVDSTLIVGDKPGDCDQWGIEIAGDGSFDSEKMVKAGCQFAVVTSDDVPAEVLLSEDVAFGLPVQDGLSDSRIRAIDDGPFEFLTYRPESISWPLTIGTTMALQELVSSFSKHIFLDLSAISTLPGEKDLEVLKNLPISAVIIDLKTVSADESAELRKRVAALEPRKPASRSDRSPLVPMSSRGESADATGDDGFDEDDDDNWDDQ